MNQKLEYIFLRNNLTLNNLPFLRMMQMRRAQENVMAGLELGLSSEESIKMAMEDFRNPAELAVEKELNLNLIWLSMQDRREIYQEMLVMDMFPNSRG